MFSLSICLSFGLSTFACASATLIYSLNTSIIVNTSWSSICKFLRPIITSPLLLSFYREIKYQSFLVYSSGIYAGSVIIYIYSTPKETHHLYAFTVVKKFNWR